MRRPIMWFEAGLTTALVALATAAQAVDVPLDAVPQPVIATVKARFVDIKMVGAGKEKNEQGALIYEISLNDNGMNIDVTLTPEGKITLIEKQITRKELPDTVAKTLEGKYPKARYKIVEQVYGVKEKEETLSYYEVLLITPQKQIRAVEIDSRGKILKVEKKTSEEEDED